MNDVVVERLGDHATLIEEWRTLFPRSENGSIFLSPAWMEAWLAGAPSDAELLVVKGKAGGTIVLLGVVGVPKTRRPKLIGPTTAHLHEFGEPGLDAVYIEYNDFLMALEAPADLRETALNALIDSLGEIDELVLRNSRPALAIAARNIAAARGGGYRLLQEHPTFSIDLNSIRSVKSDYIETRSASLRSQVRRTERLYQQRGAVKFERAENPEDSAEAWRSLQDLHQESWRRRGVKGAFANAALVAFHERLSRVAPASIDIFRLYAGDEVIACLYNLVEGDRAYNYQSGFKFEENNQLKPGMLAHMLAAQYYLTRGYSVYDLLAGEAPYKRRLGDEGDVLTTLVLELASGPRARIRNGLRRLRKVHWRRRAKTRRT